MNVLLGSRGGLAAQGFGQYRRIEQRARLTAGGACPP